VWITPTLEVLEAYKTLLEIRVIIEKITAVEKQVKFFGDLTRANCYAFYYLIAEV
jgi:hypothetical protein